MEFTIGKTEVFIKGIGRISKCMDKENSTGQMEEDMLVITKMGKNMEKEHFIGQMEIYARELGTMEFKSKKN